MRVEIEKILQNVNNIKYNEAQLTLISEKIDIKKKIFVSNEIYLYILK